MSVAQVIRALVAVSPGLIATAEIDGPLSTCSATSPETADLPSRSVARTLTVCGSAALTSWLFQVTVYGPVVSGVPTAAPSTKNSTRASGTSSSMTADNMT